jgi:DNA repair exonuclease SbcCD ATPase subunit
MKINVDSVGFKNFLSFGSKWQDVPLKHGLNFVTGWDASRNKSNGAGKSSFLESIIFALYGKTARNIKKDQIINWKNKKQCEVVFRFDINDNKYEILRAIKPDKFEIYKNGSMLDQDAHVKDYQTMFEEDIFGLDLKMFTSLVHSNTNSSTTNILSMKKPEKRKLMEKMFDLTIFSRMNEICNEKLRNIQGKTRETELKIESHLNQIEEAKEMIEKFKDEIKKKAVIEKELDDMLLEFKELVDDHPGIEEDIEDLSKKIEEKEKALSNQIQKIDQKLTEIKVKIENLEDDLEESQKLEGIVKRNDELEKDIKKIEKEYGVPEQISNKMDSLKDQKKDKVEGRKKYVDLYEKIEKEMIEFNADLKNLEKNLELLKEGICPVCNTKVKDPKAHYGKEIAGIKRKITTRTKKIKPFVQDIDMLDLGIKDIDNELEILQEFKDGILELKSKIQKVTKKDTSELKEEILKHSDNVEKLYKMKAELKKKTVEEVSPLHNKWNDLKDEFSIIKRKEREVEELQTKVGVEQKNIKSFEKMIEDQEVKIDEINSQSAGLAESMQKFQTLKDYVNAIKGLLKDEKIKQHMISKIMPYLNQQANYYLSEVDYSFYVKIDKWLDIDIRGPGISNATYDSLSGGERRGIDLAIQLGFLDIARTQSGIFPDLLIFDELLDSSIDAQGIVEVLKIVRVKQNEANGKFFIISHRSEIDNDLIDHRYHVIKENGYSRIEI